MSNLSQTAKKEFQNVAHAVSDTAEEAKKTLRDAAEDAGAKARQFIEDKSVRTAELYKTTEEKIIENPIKSVAIAAIGGLLLGALLRR